MGGHMTATPPESPPIRIAFEGTSTWAAFNRDGTFHSGSATFANFEWMMMSYDDKGVILLTIHGDTHRCTSKQVVRDKLQAVFRDGPWGGHRTLP